MKAITLGSLIFLMIFLLGCGDAGNSNKQRASMVADKALRQAKMDSVDLHVYALHSVQLLRDGQLSAVHESTVDPYVSSVKVKLKGKKYWEACYTVIDDWTVGAIYCYYFDYSNLNYIAKFSIK